MIVCNKRTNEHSNKYEAGNKWVVCIFNSLCNVFANHFFCKHICAPTSATTVLFPAAQISNERTILWLVSRFIKIEEYYWILNLHLIFKPHTSISCWNLEILIRDYSGTKRCDWNIKITSDRLRLYNISSQFNQMIKFEVILICATCRLIAIFSGRSWRWWLVAVIVAPWRFWRWFWWWFWGWFWRFFGAYTSTLGMSFNIYAHKI